MGKRRRLESYEVESIQERKEIEGLPHYRVRWKDYPPEEDTWEPLEHLQAVLPMVQAFEARLAKQNKTHMGIRKGPKATEAVPAAPTPQQGSLDTDEVNRLVDMWKQGDRVLVCEVEYKDRRTGQSVRNSQERVDVLRYRCPQLLIDLMMSLVVVDTASKQ